MNREQALAKIAKCLRLSKSANEHEAAAALRQAQALMREHGLSGDDVKLADVAEKGTPARSVAVNAWESKLAHLVSQAFGCQHYHQLKHVALVRNGCPARAVRKVRSVVFVGLQAAPEVATYAYEVLSRQCLKARTAYVAAQPARCKSITKTARGDEFALGWVHGVRGLVQGFAGRSEDQLLIAQYLKAQHPDLTNMGKPRDTAVGRNIGNSAWDGIQAGKAARLERGVSASAGAQQLAHSGSAA